MGYHEDGANIANTPSKSQRPNHTTNAKQPSPLISHTQAGHRPRHSHNRQETTSHGATVLQLNRQRALLPRVILLKLDLGDLARILLAEDGRDKRVAVVLRVRDAGGGRIRDLVDQQLRRRPLAVLVHRQRELIVVGDGEDAEARRARDGRARIVHEVGDEVACLISSAGQDRGSA